jgi:hypothetical protein
MKPTAITITLIVSVWLSGCFRGPVEDHKIVGDYRLMAMDTEEQMSIWCGKWGRVEETVFAVGFDKRYIVAKQHPNGHRNVTNYFYIDMTADSPSEAESKHVTGPLTEAEFIAHQQRLGLPSFSHTITNLQ